MHNLGHASRAGHNAATPIAMAVKPNRRPSRSMQETWLAQFAERVEINRNVDSKQGSGDPF
jgi:hypothetical protein